MASGALLTSSLNIMGALVALLTSYYAYRANRLVSSSVLWAISVGFMLLGFGLVVDAGTSLISGRTLVDITGRTAGESFADKVLTLFASLTYLTLQMVAYLIIAIGYARSTYGRQLSAAAPAAAVGFALVSLYSFAILSYFVTLLLLAFIVFQGSLLRSGHGGRFSGMVLLAFVLVFVAHCVLLVSVLALGSGLFLIGTSVQFLGFLCLLIFVVRSEVVGPG
ncbi:MAG TPA: hypothetical protein VEJ19_07065 [Nitrososphaerales archaeon]|nr:hypothetical protein [Nitrososphaerales archaeon]